MHLLLDLSLLKLLKAFLSHNLLKHSTHQSFNENVILSIESDTFLLLGII